MQNTFLSLLVIFIFQASLLSNAYLQRFSMISKKVVSQSLKRSQKLFQTTNDWTEELISTTAFKACQIAGLKILEGSNTISLQDDIISKIGSRDIVTKVDMEVQEVIKDSILSIFPNHKFLGEEDVLPGRDESTKATENCMASKPTSLWICDPIDGTTNFAHGMPLSGIILAFVSNGELVYGMIYDPFRNETFSAWKGKGAYLDGKRIQCCKTSLLKDAIVCTGSPPNLSSLNACLRATNLISKDVRTMRMLGSASHMTSWLACGRVTAYFEAGRYALNFLYDGSLIISKVIYCNF